MTEPTIPLSDCVDGGIYRIHSRNLRFGLFSAKTSGFTGIREKFNYEYLFTEYHVDTGPPGGTTSPKEYLGQFSENESDETLFEYLKELELKQNNGKGGFGEN